MKISITYKGTTVNVEGDIDNTGQAIDIINIINATIDKLNNTCTNCTCEKPESYGK